MTKPTKHNGHRPAKDMPDRLMSDLPTPTAIIGKLWPIIRDNQLPPEQHIPVRQAMARLRHLELFLSNTVLRKREERLLQAEKGVCSGPIRCQAAAEVQARLEALRARDSWYRTQCIQCQQSFFSAFEWRAHYTAYNTCLPVEDFALAGLMTTAHGFWIFSPDAKEELEPRSVHSADDVAMTEFQQRSYGLDDTDLEELEAELLAAGAGKLPATLPQENTGSLDHLDDLLDDDDDELDDLI